MSRCVMLYCDCRELPKHSPLREVIHERDSNLKPARRTEAYDVLDLAVEFMRDPALDVAEFEAEVEETLRFWQTV